MKKLIVFLMIIPAVFSSIDASAAAMERKKDKQEQIQAVIDSLQSGSFKVEITNILPSGLFRPRSSVNGYFFEIRDSLFTSYLPYFGVSRKSFPGTSLAVECKECRIEYELEYNEKKRYYETEFEFTVPHTGERWDAYMTIFENGRCSLYLNSDYRDSITYLGELKVGN